MEPRIQYAQTSDGVNIAFATVGNGLPLVLMPWPPFCHVQIEWDMPDGRRQWYERLAEHRFLVRYDRRGSGLSEIAVLDHSLDAHVGDLEAVVDRLGLDEFALIGQLYMGPVAIAYAARHPERVSHLLLWCSLVGGGDWVPPPQLDAADALIGRDWELFSETFAQIVFGWSGGETARGLARLVRDSVDPESWQRFHAAVPHFDARQFLSQVKAPTLVMDRPQIRALSSGSPRTLASHIPDARLAFFDGSNAPPWRDDNEVVATAIVEFLGEDEGAELGAEGLSTDIVHTILFTDVEGSTALTDRLGDAKARDLLREHERTVREALKTHSGSEVKAMGDGFMASFSSATRALECAIAIQSAFAERNESAEEPIKVRIGLNAGEPITEDDPGGRSDLFGTAVNMAARIASKADAGEILVADVVRQLVAGKEFLFADRGDTELRGFEDPVRLYEVRWREG